MKIADMSNDQILALWSETCEARSKGSWMTHMIDTKVIEACTRELGDRGYFTAKAAEENRARTALRGPDGHFTEID
jgi:hypothetical protein